MADKIRESVKSEWHLPENTTYSSKYSGDIHDEEAVWKKERFITPTQLLGGLLARIATNAYLKDQKGLEESRNQFNSAVEILDELAKERGTTIVKPSLLKGFEEKAEIYHVNFPSEEN